MSANWRLENAKSPAAMLQENNPDATRMSIPRICTWYLAVFAMCVYVCLEACDYGAFVNRITNRHGHWVCSTSACVEKTVLNSLQVTIKTNLLAELTGDNGNTMFP